MKAIDAVANLRKLADLLEKHGDAEIRMVAATIWFDEKEPFMAVAREFPKPYAQEFEEGQYGNLKLQHGKLNESGKLELRIRRSAICELIEPARPARFHCPILSPEEEAELEQA